MLRRAASSIVHHSAQFACFHHLATATPTLSTMSRHMHVCLWFHAPYFESCLWRFSVSSSSDKGDLYDTHTHASEHSRSHIYVCAQYGRTSERGCCPRGVAASLVDTFDGTADNRSMDIVFPRSNSYGIEHSRSCGYLHTQ